LVFMNEKVGIQQGRLSLHSLDRTGRATVIHSNKAYSQNKA